MIDRSHSRPMPIPIRVRQPVWFSTLDLCERWGCCEATVRRRVKREGLRALRGPNGGYRIREDWLLDWEDEHSRHSAVEG